MFQLEEQTLRGEARQSRRNWMPTACEEALRTAAGASLAEECGAQSREKGLGRLGFHSEEM